MNELLWAAALLAVIGWDAVVITWLLNRWERTSRRRQMSWFDHQRFVHGTQAAPPSLLRARVIVPFSREMLAEAIAERIKAYSQPKMIAHPCSFGGDLLEYPVTAGWDEDAILETLAQIEAL